MLSVTRIFFAYPFRAFFASAAVLAVVAVPLWLAMLLHGWRPGSLFAPLHWHQHEMLFGFLHAAIAGFLLTAVCAWTGTPRLHGARLAGLWIVWASGRVTMLCGEALPATLVHAVDLMFLPLVMLDAGWRIVGARQPRHLVILIVLAGLWAMELGYHLQPTGPFAHGALILAMTLMLVIGGRITPAFSISWLRASGRDPSAIRVVPALEILTLASMMAVLAAVLLGLPATVLAIASGLAMLVTTIRLLLWRGWLVRQEPLLWILHVALAWIPLSLGLLAASAWGWAPSTAWVHAAGTGAMGTLILGVMSRVALGHTGRALVLPRGMTLAFALVLSAALVRVLAALGDVPWREGLLISGGLWVAAFALFLWRYLAILVGPRVDGKPG